MDDEVDVARGELLGQKIRLAGGEVRRGQTRHAEIVHDDAGARALDDRAEDGHGTIVERLDLEPMRAVRDVEDVTRRLRDRGRSVDVRGHKSVDPHGEPATAGTLLDQQREARGRPAHGPVRCGRDPGAGAGARSEGDGAPEPDAPRRRHPGAQPHRPPAGRGAAQHVQGAVQGPGRPEQREAVPGVAEALLEATAQGAREQVGRDVRVAEDGDARDRPGLAARRPSERGAEVVERVTRGVLERNGERGHLGGRRAARHRGAQDEHERDDEATHDDSMADQPIDA